MCVRQSAKENDRKRNSYRESVTDNSVNESGTLYIKERVDEG